MVRTLLDSTFFGRCVVIITAVGVCIGMLFGIGLGTVVAIRGN